MAIKLENIFIRFVVLLIITDSHGGEWGKKRQLKRRFLQGMVLNCLSVFGPNCAKIQASSPGTRGPKAVGATQSLARVPVIHGGIYKSRLGGVRINDKGGRLGKTVALR